MTSRIAAPIAIDADNAEAAEHLNGLAALVAQHGGSFAEGARVLGYKGELTLVNDRASERQSRLLTVPHATMPDIGVFRVRFDGQRFNAEPASKDHRVSKVQQQVIGAMIELYNAMDKPRQWAMQCPWLTLWHDPQLLHQLIDQPINELGGPPHLAAYRSGDWETTLVESFLKSRTFRLKPGMDSTRKDTADVLMPFLDFLNHHFGARGFQHCHDASGGAVYTYQDRPVPDSTECFVRYRMVDAHASFVGYAFLDDSAPFTLSQAGTVVLADKLQLEIRRNAAKGFDRALPKGFRDLRLHMPYVTSPDPKRLVLSRLLIPGTNAPKALRRVLGLVISRKRPNWTRAGVERAVVDAETQILEMNHRFFDAVATRLAEAWERSRADNPPGRQGTLRTIDELVRRQKGHLAAYKARIEGRQ